MIMKFNRILTKKNGKHFTCI